jgi:hypothetical protein
MSFAFTLDLGLAIPVLESLGDAVGLSNSHGVATRISSANTAVSFLDLVNHPAHLSIFKCRSLCLYEREALIYICTLNKPTGGDMNEKLAIKSVQALGLALYVLGLIFIYPIVWAFSLYTQRGITLSTSLWGQIGICTVFAFGSISAGIWLWIRVGGVGK